MTNVKVALQISGLSCGGGGALSIERVVKRLPGVAKVYVNPATETAYVDYTPDQVSPEQIARAVRELGYRTMIAGEEAGAAKDHVG